MDLFRIVSCVGGEFGSSILFSGCPQLVFLSGRASQGKLVKRFPPPFFFNAFDVFT